MFVAEGRTGSSDRPIIHDERLELMHTGSVCLIAGALLGLRFGIHLQLVPLFIAAGAAASAGLSRGSAHGSRALAAVLLGLALATAALHRGLDARLPLASDGAEVALLGRVCGLPAERYDRTRLELCRHQATRLRRVRLYLYGVDRPQPRAGELWAVRARLRVPLSYLNPAGPDLAADHLFDGLDATGTVRVARRVDAAGRYGAARQMLADAVARNFPDEGGLARALLLGARDRLTAEDWDLLRRTGTAHLVAISGLHVMLVAGWVLAIAARVQRVRPGRGARSALAPVLGLMVAALYAGLAGGAIPTRRALAMLAVVVIAHLARRPQRPMHTLTLAAGAVVLLDPLAVAQTGYWLSVCAVAALLIASADGAPGWRSLLRAQLTVVLATAPLVSLIGGVLGPATLVANLMAIPWVGVAVLPPLLLGALAEAIGMSTVAGWLWWVSDAALSVLRAGLGQLADWPNWDLPPPAGPFTAALASSALIVALAAVGRGRSWFRGCAALTVAVVAMLWARPEPLPVGALTATVVDVGQGLAVVVRTRNHVMVYDTGPSWRGSGAAADITLVPVLRRYGVTRIDRLVISHADDDHAGGAASVARAFVVADRIGAGGRACRRGQRWDWDGVRFSVLHPPDRSWSDNDGSCVIQIEATGGRLLLSGDLEARGEDALLASGDLTRNDVVIVPHHGSATSSTRRFVSATAPGLVVVPAGRGNRWRFPRIEVVRRWRDVGARVLVTGQVGAVSLTIDRDGLDWTTELQRQPWPWRAYGMMREP
jgi:competence protein ComEC